MKALAALSLIIAPVAAATVLPLPATAQSNALAQVSAHLRAVDTMVADFSQTDRKGQTLTGTLTLKRPGKIRFQYQKGVPMLIVSDGKRINMIDYEVRRVESLPLGTLGVLLNPDKDLSRVAKVVQDDAQVTVVQARDPRHPEYPTITIAFTKGGGPAGLMMRGWTALDAQGNRTTVRLSNQRFNVAVADSAFRWTDPRRPGPRG